MKKYRQISLILILTGIFLNYSKIEFDQSHFSCLPKGAEALLSINLNKVLTIPEVDKFIQQELVTNPQQKIFRLIYNNLRKDTARATLAFYQTQQSTSPSENPILAINTKISKKNLLKILDDEKMPYTLRKVGVDEVISISKPDGSKDLILFRKNNLVLLEEKNFDFYQQEMKKGGDVLQSPLLKNSLKKISPQKMIFLVAGSFTPLKEQTVFFQMPMPKEFIAEIDYQQEKFLGMINLNAANEAEAQNIINILNGIKTLILIGASEKNPDTVSLLQKVNLSAQKEQVRIEFNFSISELKKLKKTN